ncbi:MAG: thiamine diphosphokinase [Bacteroidales bacterium]|nr:thiamine diphosphokinase [Bacteroidales bacterium]
MSKKTIILANGLFPSSEENIKLIREAETLVCCDGAANHLIDLEIEPTVIIGDLDSLKDEYKIRWSDRLIGVSEQQSNDLTKAVNWCINNNYNQVIIMGATGLREDHTIGNIALLGEYSRKLDVVMYSDYGHFIPINRSTVFEAKEGQQISVFSFNPEIKISSKGLKYPLDQLSLRGWWMGTLNESIGEQFELIFKTGASVIVYFSKEVKKTTQNT